jgi:hypothetical protein
MICLLIREQICHERQAKKPESETSRLALRYTAARDSNTLRDFAQDGTKALPPFLFYP